jgi:hypothetical protein
MRRRTIFAAAAVAAAGPLLAACKGEGDKATWEAPAKADVVGAPARATHHRSSR